MAQVTSPISQAQEPIAQSVGAETNSLHIPLEIIEKISSLTDGSTRLNLLCTSRSINVSVLNQTLSDLIPFYNRFMHSLHNFKSVIEEPLSILRTCKTPYSELQNALLANPDSLFPMWFNALPDDEKATLIKEIDSIETFYVNHSTFPVSAQQISLSLKVKNSLEDLFAMSVKKLATLSPEAIKLLIYLSDKTSLITNKKILPSLPYSTLFDDLLTAVKFYSDIQERIAPSPLGLPRPIIVEDLTETFGEAVSTRTLEVTTLKLFNSPIPQDGDNQSPLPIILSILSEELLDHYIAEKTPKKCLDLIKTIHSNRSRDFVCNALLEKAFVSNKHSLMKSAVDLTHDIPWLNSRLSSLVLSELKKDQFNTALGLVNLLSTSAEKDRLCSALIEYLANQGDLRRMKRIAKLTSEGFDKSLLVHNEALALGVLGDFDKAFETLDQLNSYSFDQQASIINTQKKIAERYAYANIDDLNIEKLETYLSKISIPIYADNCRFGICESLSFKQHFEKARELAVKISTVRHRQTILMEIETNQMIFARRQNPPAIAFNLNDLLDLP